MDRDALQQVFFDMARELHGEDADVVRWLKHPEAVRYLLNKGTYGMEYICCSWASSLHDRKCPYVQAMYELGHGVAMSEDAALHYFHTCAQQGIDPADPRLATMSFWELYEVMHPPVPDES